MYPHLRLPETFKNFIAFKNFKLEKKIHDGKFSEIFLEKYNEKDVAGIQILQYNKSFLREFASGGDYTLIWDNKFRRQC
ncbi:1479_t:CDS:1, partial [Dentiscutata heterogama]